MQKIIFLFSIILFFSCLDEKEKTIHKGLDFKEVEKLGFDLQEGFIQGDIKAINSLYDKYSLANKFLLKTSKKRVLEFNKGFYYSFAREFNFGKILIEEKKNEASYEFVKFYKDKSSNYHLLFRFFSADGINYHDHLLKKVKGTPKIVDTYIFMSGENLSDTYKTIYKSALYGSNFLTKDISNSRFVKDLDKLKKIRLLNSKGKFKKSHKVYQSISSTSKQEKIYKLTNINITSNISLELYEEALDDYDEKYPNDPSLQLMAIDRYLIKKEYDKSLLAIDKLDSLVKGDTFLNYLRGNVSFQKKDFNSALSNYKYIIKEYPDFFDVYESLFSLYVNTNDSNNALNILDIYVSKFDISKEEIKSNYKDIFPSFINTTKFKNWCKI